MAHPVFRDTLGQMPQFNARPTQWSTQIQRAIDGSEVLTLESYAGIHVYIHVPERVQ